MINEWYGAWCDLAAWKSSDWPEYVWSKIVGVYDRAIEMYPDKYPEGMSGEEAALETARLVFMMEYEDQLWCPPGMDDGIVTEHVRAL